MGRKVQSHVAVVTTAWAARAVIRSFVGYDRMIECREERPQDGRADLTTIRACRQATLNSVFDL
jgi:hypothetical protein